MNSKLTLSGVRNPELPLYMQIADKLRMLIDNRTLRPGERIPPTRELRNSFEVSTITVEAGIRKLVEENYLVRHPRRGTFINPDLGSVPDAVEEKLTIRIIFGEVDLKDLYWYIVLNAIESAPKLEKADKLFTSLHAATLTPGRIEELVDGCSGLLLCGYSSLRFTEELSRCRIPFAMIGGFSSDTPGTFEVDAVMHDDIHRAYLSTRHLLDLDHRDICCIAGPGGSRLARDIETGYRAAMREYNLTGHDGDFITVRSHTIKEGRETGLKILTRIPRPSAVYACDDRLAVGIAKAAFHLGFKIPDDLSIIGSGNQEIGKVVSPEITSTPSYPERSAAIAIDKLLGQLRDPDHRKSRTILQIDELVIGGSTRIWRPNRI